MQIKILQGVKPGILVKGVCPLMLIKSSFDDSLSLWGEQQETIQHALTAEPWWLKQSQEAQIYMQHLAPNWCTVDGFDLLDFHQKKPRLYNGNSIPGGGKILIIIGEEHSVQSWKHIGV